MRGPRCRVRVFDFVRLHHHHECHRRQHTRRPSSAAPPRGFHKIGRHGHLERTSCPLSESEQTRPALTMEPKLPIMMDDLSPPMPANSIMM